MKNHQEPKYPVSLFWIGFFMNMIKNFFLLFSAIILLIVGIWVELCLFIGLGLLALDIIVSLVGQMQIRNAALNSDNLNFKEWQEAILSPEWKENIKDLTESKIEDAEDEDSDNSLS